MKQYTDYIMEQAVALLNIDSPSGYGKYVMEYLLEELERIGAKAWLTKKGGVIADFGGEDENDAILLESHCDTLGAMVHQIKGNGRLKCRSRKLSYHYKKRQDLRRYMSALQCLCTCK